MYANVLTGMMPRPNTVWPPTGLPMPGAPVQPSVPVAKPNVTQSVPAASSEYQYVFLATILGAVSLTTQRTQRKGLA